MKILMVCLGNICRSPLAHGIMEHLIHERELTWEVDSAGTGNWHVGQGPDPRSTRVAQYFGINISKQVCRQFSVADFDDYDHIIVMDKGNKRDVLSLARNDADRKKVRLLLADDEEVPDPYHNDTMFAPVFKLVEAGCKQLLNDLLKEQ